MKKFAFISNIVVLEIICKPEIIAKSVVNLFKMTLLL